MLATRQRVLRRFWYPVIPSDHLADGPKPFTLLGEKIVLWRDGQGRFSALADRCCHRTAALSRGYYDGGVLVCGYHGWTYDHTGKVIRIPQLTREKAPDSARVKAYLAEERYGYVWMCLDDKPLFGIPEIEEWHDPKMRRIPQFYEVWNCAGLRLMENSFDNAHVNFTHRATFGAPEDAGESHTDLIPEPWGFRTKTVIVCKQTEIAARANRIEGDKTTRYTEGTWWMPFMRRVSFAYPNGLTHVILTAATPIDDESSQIVQFCLRSDREEEISAADCIAFDRKVTEEDRYILETTDPDVPLTDTPGERNMASDKLGIEIRRRMLALLREHGEEEVRRSAS
jgi:phenylpropionate dioxygenase-like ring-hydroxylating dioxygenase large terminal subunit